MKSAMRRACPNMVYASRNDAFGFAQRTRKNLAYIEKTFAEGADVHVVTQLVVSLLGLVVFPTERNVVRRLKTLNLSELESLGWPRWEFELGSSQTLDQLMHYLRNAVAHGHIHFSSESRTLSEVYVQAENYPPNSTSPNWRVKIAASDLRIFCLQFIDLVEQTIG